MLKKVTVIDLQIGLGVAWSKDDPPTARDDIIDIAMTSGPIRKVRAAVFLNPLTEGTARSVRNAPWPGKAVRLIQLGASAQASATSLGPALT